MKRYCIDTECILPSIMEEVSRVASSAYDENGNSFYDSIAITSRDLNTINGLIEDAVATLLARFSSIAYTDGGTIFFDIPEKRTHNMSIISPVLDRYVAMYVCSAWFQQKHKERAEEYATRATDAIDKAEKLLLEKLPPIVPEHIDN